MPQSIVQYNKELPYVEDRNPWEVPTCYLKKKSSNEYDIVQGRRPSRMLLVNKLRAEIDKWRNDGYPGSTTTSQDLLNYWFEQSHSPVLVMNHFIFTSAREAIESIIYFLKLKGLMTYSP